MGDNIKDQRKANRERLHNLWKIAKTGNLESLAGEERRLAEILLEHEDQYSSQFENADQSYDHGYGTSEKGNPFLHIMIHSAIERQLESKDPVEALQFYNSMIKKKVSRHDTIHLISAILTPLMVDAMRQNIPFDKEKYQAALKKYKGKKPDRIYESLDKKP